jgi:hypothetical protein
MSRVLSFKMPDESYMDFLVVELAVLHPPLPLQEFLPLHPPSPELHPPWPLQSFLPLQSCVAPSMFRAFTPALPSTTTRAEPVRTALVVEAAAKLVVPAISPEKAAAAKKPVVEPNVLVMRFMENPFKLSSENQVVRDGAYYAIHRPISRVNFLNLTRILCYC